MENNKKTLMRVSFNVDVDCFPNFKGAKVANKEAEKKKTEAISSVKPPFTTAVMKMILHCNACEGKIAKMVQDMEGCHHVNVDRQRNLIYVHGCLDMKSVAEQLKKSFNRKVEIVPCPLNPFNAPLPPPLEPQQPPEAPLPRQATPTAAANHQAEEGGGPVHEAASPQPQFEYHMPTEHDRDNCTIS